VHHLHHLNYFIEYIRSFGYLAPVVAVVLFTIQATLPIFPYAVLVAASVILFGGKVGILLAMLGAVLGSAICYGLCRKFGAEWFNRILLRRFGYDTGKMKTEIAFGGIMLAHLVPVFPSSMITAVAALSRVPFWSFVTATALGFIPSTLAYAGLGLYLFHIQDIKKVIIALVIILAVGFWLKKATRKGLLPHRDLKSEENQRQAS